MVADILYEDLFLIISDKFTNSMRLEILRPAHLDSLTPQFDFECYSLLSFIITYTFQREFVCIDEEMTKIILDMFHVRLCDNIDIHYPSSEFPEILKARYAEYYPIMKEDIECIKLKDGLIFRGISAAFFSHISADKVKSKESLLFGFTMSEIYKLIIDNYQKIKKYKIA